MTDEKTNDEKEIAESQKISSRDKKEIEQGLCVNCAVVSFLIMIIAMVALVL